MKQAIFLHIGTPKTGTSAVQKFFHLKYTELKKHGLLYPKTASNKDGLVHHRLSQALGFRHGNKGNIDIYGQELTNIFRELEQEINDSSVHSVLFSSENFCIPSDIKPVKEFFSDYNVRIIVYFRRHDLWWQSSYSQAVRMVKNPPWKSGIEAYIDFSKKRSGVTRYKMIVDRWAKIFGKENIIVRPYEQQQNQPNLIADLLAALGLETAIPLTLDLDLEPTNQSLHYSKLYLIDLYQRADIDHNIRTQLIESLLEKPNHTQGSYHSLISPQLQSQLIEENNADYEYIAHKFLGRNDGRLFYDPLPDPNAPWKLPKHPSIIEIIEHTIQFFSPPSPSN